MKGNMIFKTTKPSPNSGHTALAYAFAQIGSLRSPTLYVHKTIDEIKRRPEFKQRICEHLSGMADRHITREYEKLFGSGSIIEEKPELYYPD